MIGLLYTAGAWLLGSALARILVGAGLSVVYYVVLMSLAGDLIDLVLAQVGDVPSAAYNLLGLAGLWDGMGYVLSAVLARVTIQAAAPRLMKAAA